MVIYNMGFSSEFNSAINDFTRDFGEMFTFNGNPYQAIEADTQTFTTKGMQGGKFADQTTVVRVTSEVFTAAGLKKDSIICLSERTPPGRFRVLEIDADQIDIIDLICGPVQVDTGGRF